MNISKPDHNAATLSHLTIADVDELDRPLSAIADYAATVCLIADTLKNYDSDTEAALERLGENLRVCVEQIRALRNRLQSPLN